MTDLLIKINNLFFKRQNKIILQKKNESSPIPCILPITYLSTALKNLEAIGYTFSKDIIDIVSTYSEEEFLKLYREIIQTATIQVGAHVRYQPMYPNFPRQVMNTAEAELYLNAILHYLGDWIGARIMPIYQKETRYPLLDNTILTVIELDTIENFHQIFSNLMSSTTSISQSDKEDLAAYIKIYKEQTPLPITFHFKEICSFVISELLKYNVSFSLISRHFKTATDVLRLATALSNGDESLAKNTHYINFNRLTRRNLLQLIENTDHEAIDIAENMKKHQMKWIRLGERLHPSGYQKRFPKTAEAFRIIRANQKIETFNSKIEKYIAEKNIDSAAELLERYPGIFARRLDHLLRINPSDNNKEWTSDDDKFWIISCFSNVANTLTTPMLLQLISHFEHRYINDDELRIFFPKGNVAKVYAIKNELPPIEKKWCEMIISICENILRRRFSKEEKFGKVFLDPQLKNYLVPFSQRSASKALKTIVRGSIIPLNKGNTIRFFIWWTDDEKDRIDIDLSAIALDNDLQYLSHISYTNLRDEDIRCVHSGDITSAPNGACEFIDIDINSALLQNARYIIMNVLSYTEQPFCDMPECFAGWMIRQHPDSGEIFEPKTVQNKFDLSASTKICLPLIIDLETRSVIWTDLGVTNTPNYRNNIESNYSTLALMVKAMLSLNKPNLYDLFLLHVQARDGILVDEITDDTLVFSIDKGGITPFDYEIIIGDYLK